MAGESPDRSKQHESSAEPTAGTSGSAAPVPDPRLAVAREAVTAAARVDTATAVFSTTRSAGSAGSVVSEDPAAGGAQGSDGSPESEPEDAGTGAAGAAEGGDERLRDVVAAWVAGTDEEGPEGASEGAGADSGTPDASHGSGGDVEAAEEASGAAESSDGAAAEDVSDAEGSGGRGADSDDGEGDDGEGDGGVSEPEASSEAGAGAGGGADAASADADADADDSDSEPAVGADVAVDAGSEPEVGASSEAVVEGDTEASLGDTDTGTGTDVDSGPEAVAGVAVDRAAADDDTEDFEDSEDDRPVADAEPDRGADAEREPEGEPKGGVDAKVVAEPEDEAPGASADEDAPEPRVDQPTATFKVRPPVVDQPTAMLKLGDVRPATEGDKAGGKAGEKAKAGPDAEPDARPDKDVASKPAAETPAERTSKFVALKPLDEPAPPKPRPTASPAAPPAVPPAAETAAIPQVGPERTTQQPLPPKPPLDLLAELTNTPPPRQTPVRTIVRRVKIWTPLVLLLAVVFAVVQAVRPLPAPVLTLTADESYAFEGDKAALPWPDEGQGWMDVNGIGTVDTFGEQKPVAIGSVAKAMTAYVILRDHPLKAGEKGESIPVDAKAETEGGFDKDGESTLNTIKEGDTLTEKQAIEAIMIPSANNVARLLARWDAGSEEAFVKKMNDAAKDLGMNDTTYTDPSGLKETTVSTAEDQVKLGNELVKMKALVDITKLPTWKDPSGRVWQNYNRLVPYNNAIGLKTGSTTKAGGNLLFAATQEVGGETVTVVGAVLGQHTPPIIDTVNAVSKTAMIAAQEALTSRTILKKGDVVGYVDDGLGGRTPVVATKDVSAVGWAGKTVELNLSEDGTTIPNEAKAGTKVGSLSVGDGTGDAVEVPVALQSDLTEPGYDVKLTRVG